MGMTEEPNYGLFTISSILDLMSIIGIIPLFLQDYLFLGRFAHPVPSPLLFYFIALKNSLCYIKISSRFG